eukprot:365255-Chlamydomonas_euryale.AAC.18
MWTSGNTHDGTVRKQQSRIMSSHLVFVPCPVSIALPFPCSRLVRSSRDLASPCVPRPPPARPAPDDQPWAR